MLEPHGRVEHRKGKGRAQLLPHIRTELAELSCAEYGEGAWVRGKVGVGSGRGRGGAMFRLIAGSELAEPCCAGAGHGRYQSRPTNPGHTA